MSRRCSICTSENRLIIEKAVRDGGSYRVTASQYRVSFSGMQRHVSSHMAAETRLQEEARVSYEDVMNLPADMRERREVVWELIDKCLEPLMRKHGKLDVATGQLLVRLFKVQQVDEITTLRVAGLLTGGKGLPKATKAKQEYPVWASKKRSKSGLWRS